MNYDYIPIRHAVHYNGYIYFVINITKELYRIDEKTGALESLGIIPWGVFGRMESYLSLAAWKNRILVIPYFSNFMPIYNIDKRDFDRAEFPRGKEESLRCMAYAVLDDHLFMFSSYGRVIKFNLLDNSIDGDCDLYEDVVDEIFDKTDDCFRQQTVIVGKDIITPFCNLNALLIVDSIDMGIRIEYLGDDNNGYSGICHMNEKLWCAPRRLDGYVMEYSLEDGSKTKHTLQSDDKGSFVGISFFQNKVCLYPGTQCSVYSDDDYIDINGDAHAFIYQDEKDHSILRFNRITKQFVIENICNHKTQFEINKEDISTRIIERARDSILFENTFSGIRELIYAI